MTKEQAKALQDALRSAQAILRLKDSAEFAELQADARALASKILSKVEPKADGTAYTDAELDELAARADAPFERVQRRTQGDGR